jgi:hypothetical protein
LLLWIDSLNTVEESATGDVKDAVKLPELPETNIPALPAPAWQVPALL